MNYSRVIGRGQPRKENSARCFPGPHVGLLSETSRDLNTTEAPVCDRRANMIALNPTQALALGNLARKHDGFDVGYIRIAEARALTDMGFAQRQPSGWRITEAGLAHFKQFVSSKDSPAEIGETKGKPKKAKPQPTNVSNPSLKGLNAPPAKPKN
eukprot:gene15026-15165_t